MEMAKTGICFWMLNVTCLFDIKVEKALQVLQVWRSDQKFWLETQNLESSGHRVFKEFTWSESKKRSQEGAQGTPVFRGRMKRNKQRELGTNRQ